ncbi:unnamed protein product, partial [Mesorhabditis belari]|uniref:Thioredoxin domain-containing protein n=1 Tax=Mesorhabditis belari TaxID=2138241 RepID=A0AAF3EUA5_9BILA
MIKIYRLFNVRLLRAQHRPCSSKKPDDLSLDKDLNELNERLKKDFQKTIDTEAPITKNYMNFRQDKEREAHKRSGIFSWKVAAATLMIGGTCLAALLYVKKMRIDEREKHRKMTAGKARIGGEWELVNTDGKLEGSEQLRGNWLLLYFGFTNCPDICPDEIEKMIKVVDLIEAKKEDNISIKPIFISVDPARDTVQRVKQYCSEFSPKLNGYTGTKEQVGKVAKTFRVYHSEGPKTTEDDYIVDHTVIMYLIDPEGNFHDYYGQNRKANEIADIIRLKVIGFEAAQKKKSFLGF